MSGVPNVDIIGSVLCIVEQDIGRPSAISESEYLIGGSVPFIEAERVEWYSVTSVLSCVMRRQNNDSNLMLYILLAFESTVFDAESVTERPEETANPIS
jgi:hypothetical protein